MVEMLASDCETPMVEMLASDCETHMVEMLASDCETPTVEMFFSKVSLWCCGTRNPAIWGLLLARAFTTRKIRAIKMCKLTVALTSRQLVH